MMSEEAFNEIVEGFEHIRTLTEWGSKNIKHHIQKLQQKNKSQKETIDKSYIKVTRLLDYYNHYKTLPDCIIDELINLQNDLDTLKEVSE